MYTQRTLRGVLMNVYHDLAILTSNQMLLLIIAASNLTNDFEMCILGHSFGGYIGSIMVDQLVSALVL